MHVFYILEKRHLYNQDLVVKIAMNQNQMRKTCQTFGCACNRCDNTSYPQINISPKIYLRNSLGRFIESFNDPYAVCICILVVYKCVYFNVIGSYIPDMRLLCKNILSNVTWLILSTVSGITYQFVFIGSKAMRKTVRIDFRYHQNGLRYSLPVQNTKNTQKMHRMCKDATSMRYQCRVSLVMHDDIGRGSVHILRDEGVGQGNLYNSWNFSDLTNSFHDMRE